MRKTLNFNLRLDVGAYHLEITANKLEGVVTVMSERDLRTHDTNVAINAAKNEHESKDQNDHTVIRSTLKIYAKVYKELRST